VRVTGNRVHDRSGTGIALRTPVQTSIVKENVVQDVGVGVAIEGQGAAERVAVDNNEVLDVATNEGANTAFGIVLTRATSAALVGNTIARVGQASTGATLRAGVLVFAIEDLRVSQNVINEIGPEGGFLGSASGLVVVGPFDAASIAEHVAFRLSRRGADGRKLERAARPVGRRLKPDPRRRGQGRGAGEQRRRRADRRVGIPRGDSARPCERLVEHTCRRRAAPRVLRPRRG
jgi:hypothetical protein